MTDLTTDALCASGPVRALEWMPSKTSYTQATCVLGQYQITFLGEFECWQLSAPHKQGTDWKDGFTRHASKSAAKAAAQADYERRILAALTPAPQPTPATPTAQEAVPVDLTYQQKLEALSLRFYQGMLWTPKAGDYYTTSRADLELYRVVAVEGGMVKTQYCDQSKSSAVSSWPEKEFTSEGFGPKRVWVPDFVLSAHPPQPSEAVVEALHDADQTLMLLGDTGWRKRHRAEIERL